MPISYGTNSILKSSRLAYDPMRGLRANQVFEGTRDQMTILALTLNPYTSWETNDTQESRSVELSITTPDQDNLQTVWGIRANQLNKSLLEHPRTKGALAGLAGVSTSDLTAIRQYFAGPQNTDTPAGLSGSATANALFQALRHEETHYITPAYVLHMRSVGMLQNCFNAVLLDPNFVGTIFPPETIMSGGAFDLFIAPAVQAFMWQLLAPIDVTVPTGYAWGYLFQTPTIEPLPGGKHELRQEWHLYIWNLYDYGLAQNDGTVVYYNYGS